MATTAQIREREYMLTGAVRIVHFEGLLLTVAHGTGSNKRDAAV